MSKSRRHWQKILLCEWRNCEDQEYARELFSLISAEPVIWWAPALAYLLAGVFYGLLGGLLVGVFACGCTEGPAKDWILTQRFWTEIAPFEGKGISIGGAVGLALGLLAGWRSTWGRLLDRLGRLVRQLVGILANLLKIILVGGLVGTLAAALLHGLRVSHGVGVLVIFLVVGLVFWLVLAGLLAVLAAIYTAMTARTAPNPDTAYTGRSMFFWWRTRPLAAEVEAALRAVASGPWVELLHRLDALKGSHQDPMLWIAKLSDGTWQERFLARHVLGALGGVAVEPLRPHDSPTARWLFKSIAAETTRQLGSRAASLLCPRCFARCQQHRAPLKRGAITYYGCRLCRQSVEWLEAREAVAVLDSQMALPWRQRDGRLYVDGLTRGAPFDYDRVAIVYATDDEVERFCMQVGNDTDDYRRPRYRTMPYEVGCALSENTRRILQQTFGGA